MINPYSFNGDFPWQTGKLSEGSPTETGTTADQTNAKFNLQNMSSDN